MTLKSELKKIVSDNSNDDVVFESEDYKLIPFSGLSDENIGLIRDIYSSDFDNALVVPQREQSEETYRKIVTNHSKIYTDSGLGLLKIIRKSDNRPIGITGLTEFSSNPNNEEDITAVELNIALLESESGSGQGTNVSLQMINQAASLSKKMRVDLYATLLPYNFLSRKLIEKYAVPDGVEELKDNIKSNQILKYRCLLKEDGSLQAVRVIKDFNDLPVLDDELVAMSHPDILSISDAIKNLQANHDRMSDDDPGKKPTKAQISVLQNLKGK